MRRLILTCATLGIAASAFAFTSPAQAGSYHLIRWSSGYCQAWDEFWPVPGWPTDYSIITGRLATWDEVLATKARLIEEHRCRAE
jgi:hypothetical protein